MTQHSLAKSRQTDRGLARATQIWGYRDVSTRKKLYKYNYKTKNKKIAGRYFLSKGGAKNMHYNY